MWQTVTAVLGILTFTLGVPGVFIIVRRSIQSPVREQLTSMKDERDRAEKDRDYYRGRVDALEDFIRESGRRVPE